jgi:subtilisin family serine protease
MIKFCLLFTQFVSGAICSSLFPVRNLEGMGLSLATLEKVKKGDVASFAQKGVPIENVQKALFWYQELPTIGLRPTPAFFPPHYPFIPHQFTLWQLAPHRGAGVKVAIIDSGVASFAVEDDHSYQKNVDLPDQSVGNAQVNIVDPGIETLTLMLKPYVASKNDLHQQLIILVNNYHRAQADRSKLVFDFIKTIPNQKLVSNGHITECGKRIAFKMMRVIERNFSLVSVQGESVISQFLPAAQIKGPEVFAAGHGSHMTGIIAGKVDPGNQDAPVDDTGICGLAPDASVYMIKAFEGNSSTKATLLKALESAQELKVDILNLSLKIAQNPNPFDAITQNLMRLFSQFPYAVVASGNATYRNANRLSYPARFGGLIDVGGFGYDAQGNYPILPYSQYERGVGPKFVMPGFNILSSGLLPGQKTDSMYVFMSGTSPATAIMSGALALIIGEFQNDFTREQIMEVLAHSGVFLHDTKEWADHSLLGTLDIRLCLFTLHVLKELKKYCSLENRWTFWIRKVQRVIFGDLTAWASRYNIGNPRKNFGAVMQRSMFLPQEFDTQESLSACVNKVVRKLLAQRIPCGK